MSTLKVDKKLYSNAYAHLANVHPISEYSETVDREVLNDRTHARHIAEENTRSRDNVYLDLKKGIDTFIDKCEGDTNENESRLHPLCAWACAQEGNDLKQIFSGAKFVGRRGTIRSIATTIYSHATDFKKPPYSVIAVKCNDVILLCEKTKPYAGDGRMSNYSGCKFEQYMTTDKPDGEVDTDAPVDTRHSFKMMVVSDLTLGDQSIKICCSSAIDAMLGDAPLEIKTHLIKFALPHYKALHVVIQSGLAGINNLVLGLKTKNFVVREVKNYQIGSLKSTLKKDDEKCLAFLFNVLRSAQHMLASKEACEISYVPAKGVVEFTEFPKKEAMDLLTPEFKKKFNLED